MKSNYARWGFTHLLAILMIVAAGSAFAAGESLLHNSNNLGTTYGTWGVVGGKYGEITCATCHNKTTSNVKRIAQNITAPMGSWSSSQSASVAVTFNNMTAFGTDAGGHTTSARICEVCHSQTTVHRYNTTGQADLDHKGANQTDCTSCHSHADAFKGKGCTSCHGSTAASANPITTGKHSAHMNNAGVLGQNYGCADCHAKSVTDDETIKSAPTAHQNTTYGDYSGARAGGSYAAGNCSNVYCHTDGKGGAPATAVNWATGPALDCKGCHGAGGTYGEPAYVGGNSHGTHVSSAADCVSCHYATTANGTAIKAGGSHTNQSVDVDGSSSIGFAAGPKTCSTASCHADPYSAGTVTTPAWGTSAGCAACHSAFPIGATGPATGSHTIAAHAAACTECHAAGTSETTKPSTGHADGDIDVINGYPATAKHAAGSYTGTCSTASCHPNVYGAGSSTTPVWGTTGNGCSACHSAAIGANGPATGGHTAHAGSLCTECHAAGTSETTKPSAGHADGDIDVTNGYPATAKHAAGTYAGTCSTASCHANVYGAGIVTTPVWGVDANCSACHTVAIGANGPATGSHTIAGHAAVCTECHAAGTSATTKPSTGHVDGDIDVTNGYPATAKHAAGSYTGTCSTASCHGNVYAAGSITTPVWGTTGNGCSACHSVAIGANGPATGSHTAHAGAACIDCHAAGTSETTKPSTGHADGDIDVTNGYPATAKHAAGTYTGTCSAASCHANVYGGGSVTTPVWGTTGNGCSACHSVAIGANGPATGSHTAHAGKACIECHAAGTTATTKPSANHNDGDIDVSVGGYPATAKHSAGAYSGTCSNIYCHSYGTTAGGPFTVKTVPVWGGTVNCYSCHGSDSTTGLLNNMSTGRHKKHMVGQYTYGCAVCHASTVSNNTTISDVSKHVNQQIEVGFSGTAVTGGAGAVYATTGHAPGAAGTVDQSCSNVYCHSNAQVQPGHANLQFRNLTGAKRWGQSGKLSGCSVCHGSTTTTGLFQLSGKHLAHTNTAVGKVVDCNLCHLSGGTNNNRANHSNGMVNYSSALTGSVTLSSGACATVYCHSDGKGTFTQMTSVAANWFSAKTLDCKGCHGGTSSQAGEPVYSNGGINNTLANNHPKHVGTTGANATCQNCHRRTVTGVLLNRSSHSVTLAGTSRTISYHADMNMSDTAAGVYAGNSKTFTYSNDSTKTCSNISCHSGNGLVAGVAAAQWGASLSCEGCHGGNASATNKITTGQHGKHTDQSGIIGVNFGCVECHAQTASNDTTLVGGNTTHMNALANFSGAKAGKNTASCTTAYCHSDGKGGAGATTVSWTTGPALDCKGCHGGASSQAGEPVYVSGAAGSATANTHPKHVGITGADATCQNCHGATMTGTGLNASGQHLNKTITVVQGNGKTFGYTDATKTCSNISCHSGNGMFTPVDAQWGATMPADCTGCHGNEVTAATNLSGAHNSHLNNAAAGGSFKCKDCHAPTITNADNRTIASVTNHGNAQVNYSGARAGNNKNCSNIYCHSNGKGVFAAIPAWVAGTADCQTCHATGSLSGNNAHAPHIAKGATCSQCHSATTTTDTSITGSLHIDGSVNLQQGGTFNAKSVSFVPAGGGTCNNISCHSPAATGPYTNSATFGVAATCETCHPKAGLSGAHDVHMGSLNLTSSAVLYNMTANRSPVTDDTVRQHGFGCANCHPMNVANHLNGSIDVDLNRVNETGVSQLRFLNHSSAGYTMGSTKKCSNMYCHSNASRVEAESNVATNTSLAWTDRFSNYPASDRCAWCHGNQPTTGAHAAHAVGNHTDNIYNGKSGKVSTSNRANTAHGNANNSTTIGCYICHQGTVTSKANDKNTKCVVCHYAGNPVGAVLKGTGAIANLKNHVNGSREIQFLPIQVVSKAQIRPESFKFYSGVWQRTTYKNMSTLSYDTAKVALDTASMWHPSTPMASNCTNIACHNGKPVAWNLANWNDPNKCMDCHNQL